jgi:CRISPR system Cascade subunit CasB
MTVTETTPQTPQQVFIANLERLNPGEKARLKRNAGRTIGEARNATGLFYRLLPREVINFENQHEWYFLVATLYPLAGSSNDRSLGATLRAIRNQENQAALDRRMNVLLESDARQLPFRLRQMIRLIESHRRGVNWEVLLTDLLAWNRPGRSVQKRWAMHYYGSPPAPEQPPPESE